MNERELYRKSIIESGWLDEFSFDNYYFIKDNKYSPVNINDKEFADWLNIGWDMWQASVNRQGYRLVPVEPTEDMIDAGFYELIHGESETTIYKSMIDVVGN